MCTWSAFISHLACLNKTPNSWYKYLGIYIIQKILQYTQNSQCAQNSILPDTKNIFSQFFDKLLNRRYLRQKGKSQNGCFNKKQSTPNFPRKQTFLNPWYTHVRVRIRWQEMFVFYQFNVLCFLEKPVLRFTLLPYYRRRHSLC